MSAREHIAHGEEAAFVVHRTRRRLASLSIHFTGEVREALALKRVLPEFANTSSVQIAAIVHSGPLKLGPYGEREAVDIAERLEREGLRVVRTSFVEESNLLIDERGPAAHLIEDPVENRRVIEDAIRRGVRVVEDEEA